jgi:hypothetical protein
MPVILGQYRVRRSCLVNLLSVVWCVPVVCAWNSVIEQGELVPTIWSRDIGQSTKPMLAGLMTSGDSMGL